jgi:hypothetical protein
MATFYVPKIAARDYEAFRKLLKAEIPATHAEWLGVMDREIIYTKGQGHVPQTVEISADEFSEYCNTAQAKHNLAALKRLAFQKGARHKSAPA